MVYHSIPLSCLRFETSSIGSDGLLVFHLQEVSSLRVALQLILRTCELNYLEITGSSTVNCTLVLLETFEGFEESFFHPQLSTNKFRAIFQQKLNNI